jgi:hypothetical protein
VTCNITNNSYRTDKIPNDTLSCCVVNLTVASTLPFFNQYILSSVIQPSLDKRSVGDISLPPTLFHPSSACDHKPTLKPAFILLFSLRHVVVAVVVLLLLIYQASDRATEFIVHYPPWPSRLLNKMVRGLLLLTRSPVSLQASRNTFSYFYITPLLQKLWHKSSKPSARWFSMTESGVVSH